MSTILSTWVPRAAALASVCLLLSSCGGFSIQFGGDSEGDANTPAEEPRIVVPVETSAPHRGDISVYFETTTRVEAERRVDVAAKGSARCTEVLVEEGDRVTVGQILAELEKDEARASYAQAEVTVRQNLTAYELTKKQFDEGLGTKSEMDNAYYAHEQSVATLELQRLQVEYLTLRAPIDGIVTSRDIHEGMLVSAGAKIFGIMDPTSFMLAISPPEKELPNLRVGQKAKVTIDSIRGKEFSASIRRINPSVDPVSGTVKVILDFDEEVGAEMHESAFARVKLVMSTLKNVLLVPKEAIIEENGRTYVFVARRVETPDEAVAASEPESDRKDAATLLTSEVEASEKDPTGSEPPEASYRAVRIPVFTGLEDAAYIQVMSDDLTDTDRLITNGQHTLQPDAWVRLTQTDEAILFRADLSADEALEAAKKRREEGGASDGRSRSGRRFGQG